MAQYQTQIAPLGSPNYKQGAAINAIGGQQGEAYVSEFNPPLYGQGFQGKIFSAYAAGVATSLVGTAMVGLQLWNGSPLVNGVNALILVVGGNIIVTSATTTSLVLAKGTGQVNAPTSITGITTSGNNFIGSAAPLCTAYNAGTFANAPTAMFNLMHNTAAIASTGEDPGFSVNISSRLVIVPPQTWVCIAAVGGAVAAAGSNLDITWMEVSVNG
jgi:hypothetical protein